MLNEYNHIEFLQKKVKTYFENDLPIHIIYKNGQWKNGRILDIKSNDFFLIEEFLLGLTPVFYIELAKIDVYTNKKEVKDK